MISQTGNKPLVYPDSDGQPMADNTKQFDLIVSIKGELGMLFADNPDVFVAGDLLWYPVEGHPEIRVAPDTLVAFGRPKGYRGSYKQWEEGNIPPQVVFEVLSPGNRAGEMARKLQFYERHGVEEYYVLDPDRADLIGYIRNGNHFTLVEDMFAFESPRLRIRFGIEDDEVMLYRPDGRPFVKFEEIGRLHEEALELLKSERRNLEAERQKAEAERQKAERLAAQLRALGIEPEQ
jgi:Uma2 family endonuclease